jgi:Protein of unknown function (DUF1153)
VQASQLITGPKHLDDPRVAGSVESRVPTALEVVEARLVLPSPDTKRWSSRRKAAVVVATRSGVISREEACERYLLSKEELAGWEAAFDRSGIPGLRITGLHSYRAAALITR